MWALNVEWGRTLLICVGRTSAEGIEKSQYRWKVFCGRVVRIFQTTENHRDSVGGNILGLVMKCTEYKMQKDSRVHLDL